jgi:hypothetical protein
MGGSVVRVRGLGGLSSRDLLVGQRGQLFAAGFHLNGNILKRGAAEIQARDLVMVGTFDVLELAERLLFELLHLHKSILPLNCFFTMPLCVA